MTSSTPGPCRRAADLYDQLQLLQVLDRLDRLDEPRCALVQVEAFDGSVEGLFEDRQPVTPEQRALAVRAWAAFRAPEPTALQELLDEAETGPLPYAAALRRLLQEYPALGDGLAQTERLALELLDERARGPVELFEALQEAEPRPYLGDEWFWDVLADLARDPLPLLEDRHAGGFVRPPEGRSQTLQTTAAGRDAITGRRDRAWLLGVDRWLGGVHLSGREPAWRWDPESAWRWDPESAWRWDPSPPGGGTPSPPSSSARPDRYGRVAASTAVSPSSTSVTPTP